MRVLVLNSGSSSIKFQVLDVASESVLASGGIERIGTPEAKLRFRDAITNRDEPAAVADHAAGIERIASFVEPLAFAAVGHRVVHGGSRFVHPTRINAAVLAEVEQLTPLAPLHNPANLLGIRVASARWPSLPQVAVFDTAFHATMPPHAYRYAIPSAWYQKHGVRRYGFHGTSHRFVSLAAAKLLQRPLAELRLVTLHLGNGASAAAIGGGACVDTSMGLTPLEGLVMGTRSGDIDPAIVFHLVRQGLTVEAIECGLNSQSGLQGLCGAADMRGVLEAAEAGDEAARLALEVYAYRIRKTVGAYAAALQGLDAIVFTAGVGEHSPAIRQRCCAGFDWLGLRLDAARNLAASTAPRDIAAAGSRVRVLVIPTNEELQIARDTAACLNG